MTDANITDALDQIVANAEQSFADLEEDNLDGARCELIAIVKQAGIALEAVQMAISRGKK